MTDDRGDDPSSIGFTHDLDPGDIVVHRGQTPELESDATALRHAMSDV
jgi:hypothetical protein